VNDIIFDLTKIVNDILILNLVERELRDNPYNCDSEGLKPQDNRIDLRIILDILVGRIPVMKKKLINIFRKVKF
jgi:hypothetical protein